MAVQHCVECDAVIRRKPGEKLLAALQRHFKESHGPDNG